MKKLFCMSDIHGFWELAHDTLEKNGFDVENPDHIFVHCGDLMDRGPNNLKCLEFVNSLSDNRKILIWGNHEELLVDAYKRTYFLSHDIHNGTFMTVAELSRLPAKDVYLSDLTAQSAMIEVMKHPEWIKYKESCHNCAIVDEYIFVHGWIPSHFPDGTHVTALDRANGEWVNGVWKDAQWLNGMKQWSKGERFLDRTVVCGHYHTSWGHTRLHKLGVEFKDEFYENEQNPDLVEHFEPFIDEGIIALDACTAYSGEMNCVILNVADESWDTRELI